ncbi:MAG TPA: hypothetical protein VFT43_01870, partial [Candidatus Polarisedimenticolia bacterium]|nr:hypothetical protein [Candidatus Polarisedimenticolia bacterium]
TADARDIDAFLVNNRDYMVFAPVGNEGTARVPIFSSGATEFGNRYPAAFDGTGSDNDPNFAFPIQIGPPATAKNLVSVGSHFTDFQTLGSGNQEENPANFTSKGPATSGSLRMAPMILGVGADITGFFNGANANSVAVFRSRDNDQQGPVDAVLDQTNFGTSYSAGEIAGVGAIIRDYFAQGFYPTGTRNDLDRISNVSGPLVKAAIAASANFLELAGTDYTNPGDLAVGSARAIDRGTLLDGTVLGIIGNNEQGYGRPVVTSVLPLANWATSMWIGAANTIEYPAPGLLIYDELATGEPAISNARTVITHDFTINADNTRDVLVAVGNPPVQSTVKAVSRGQLRVALAWSDPPSVFPSSGSLVNDLDLELEWAGPDNNITTTADNITFDGNNYQTGGVLPGQWSKQRLIGQTDIADTHNPVEAIHLSADRDGNGDNSDSQLYTGAWRVRVKRGSGGSSGGSISQLTGAVEDLNHNGRLDPGEDTDGDGFLDADGQPYGLVVAGPVFSNDSQTFWNNAASTVRNLPASVARLDKSLYGCADKVTGTIYDPTPASVVGGAVTFEVITRTGTVVDTENGFTFTTNSSPNTYNSPSIPLRESKQSAVSFNGLLETRGTAADEPYFVRMTYADTPRNATASARISCAPNLMVQKFLVENEDARQDVISGGCDGDQFLDANETLTYTVAFVNSNRDQDFSDVTATLEAITLPAVTQKPVTVLNSPVHIG